MYRNEAEWEKNLMSFLQNPDVNLGDEFYINRRFTDIINDDRGGDHLYMNEISKEFQKKPSYEIPQEVIDKYFQDITPPLVEEGGKLFRRSLKKKMNNKKSRSMRKNKKSKTIRKRRQ